MTFKFNMILQTALTILQGANVYSAAFPKAQPYITLALTLVQAGLGFTAHLSNPDGTPASVPYIAK